MFIQWWGPENSLSTGRKCTPEDKNEAQDNDDQNDDDNYENVDNNDEESESLKSSYDKSFTID